jgi:hypothetical protein
MLTDRMIRAARLEAGLYSEVERDTNATGQAATVVIIVALAQGIGSLLAALLVGQVGAAFGNLISNTISGVIGWIIWSFVTYFVGTSLFGGRATPGEMLRCIGFANTPGILGFFVFIPCLGWLAAFIGWLWALVAGFIAVREALDLETPQAFLTVLVGWFGMILIYIILGFFNLGLGVLRPGI